MKALLLAIFLATPAMAHHDAAVGRVGGDVVMSGDGQGMELPVPRLEVGLRVEHRAYHRVLRGSDRFADGDLASIDVHRWTPTLTLRADARTTVVAELPMGGVRSEFGETKATDTGLGDARVWAAHRVAHREADESRRSAWVIGGLLLPTGRYERDAALSLVDLKPGDDGSLEVRPYDTRASLGQGAASALLGVNGRWTRDGVSALGSLSGAVPLHRTPDDIRWGADVRATAGVQAGVIDGRLTLLGQVDGAIHAADQMEQKLPDSDEIEEISSGRRGAIGLASGVQVKLSRRVLCSARGRVPLYQQVQGVQVVESWSAPGQCRVGIGLKRQSPAE